MRRAARPTELFGCLRRFRRPQKVFRRLQHGSRARRFPRACSALVGRQKKNRQLRRVIDSVGENFRRLWRVMRPAEELFGCLRRSSGSQNVFGRLWRGIVSRKSCSRRFSGASGALLVGREGFQHSRQSVENKSFRCVPARYYAMMATAPQSVANISRHQRRVNWKCSFGAGELP